MAEQAEIVGPVGYTVPAGWQPREWQSGCLQRLHKWWFYERNSGVVRAVTGAGKATMIGWFMAHCSPHAEPGFRVIVTVPTQALVRQLSATLRLWLGDETVGEYYADRKEVRPVTVCCIPSARRLLGEVPDGWVLWIADEAHRTEAQTMLDVAQWLPQSCRRLGFTATPFRTRSGERLSLFDELIFDYGPAQALRDGVLVPLQVEPYTGRGEDDLAATEWALRKARKLGPTVINASTIADADLLASDLTCRGYRGMAVHSGIDRTARDRRIEALRTRDLDALVHVNLLAEGVDLPWLTCLIARRPVGSRIRWIQEIGRVLRTAPGKERAYLFDLLDQWSAFSLSYEAVLGAETESERRARIIDEAVSSGIGTAEDKRKFREMLEAAEHDPMQLGEFQAAIRRLAVEVEQYTDGQRFKSRSWRKKPPSDKQIAFIERRPHEWRWCRQAPEEHQRILEIVGRWCLTEFADRGTASDYITVVMHPKNHGNKWMPWRK